MDQILHGLVNIVVIGLAMVGAMTMYELFTKSGKEDDDGNP